MKSTSEIDQNAEFLISPADFDFENYLHIRIKN